MSRNSSNNPHLNEPLKELLKKVGIFLKLREKANADTYGKDFTVFTILGNEFNERDMHSLFIYEILRPNGFHGMGTVFLEEFFKKVLSVEIPKNAENIEVCKEKSFQKGINNNEQGGFIDLYIETQEYAYPIEVKIKADDQPNQIQRYYDYAHKERKKNTFIFYLTLDGHPPSHESQGNVPNDKIKCITFNETIKDWLLKCEDHAFIKRSPNVASAIRQYITLIEKLSGSQKDIYMDAIQELIFSSQENYLQACAVEKNLPQVRTQMIVKVYKDLEKYLNSHPLVHGILNVKMDIDRLKTFYKQYANGIKPKTWPKICIDITPKKLTNIKLYLTIETEDSLYYGVIFTDDSFSKNDQTPKNLNKVFNNKAWQIRINNHPGNNWWVWKRFMHPKYQLNFRSFTCGYEKLYDDESYKSIMTAIYKEIDDNLKNIIETGMPADVDNIEY